MISSLILAAVRSSSSLILNKASYLLYNIYIICIVYIYTVEYYIYYYHGVIDKVVYIIYTSVYKKLYID